MKTNNLIMHMIWQSDLMTKLVLLTLLIMSVICWAIFFYKLMMFTIKQRHINSALHQLRSAQRSQDLHTLVVAMGQTIPGYLLAKHLFNVKQLGNSSPQEQLDIMIEDVVVREESWLPFLSSAAAVSPLLGLFGTVWGLIHAFVSISQAQQADIVTVAPGIAEALITTLAGLMVAIPALLMYHFLSGKVRDFELNLFRVADKLSIISQTSL